MGAGGDTIKEVQQVFEYGANRSKKLIESQKQIKKLRATRAGQMAPPQLHSFLADNSAFAWPTRFFVLCGEFQRKRLP